MALRDKLKRLERDAREEMIEIPQTDGTVKRFPQSDGVEAFMNLMDRLGAGDAAPPEHPLLVAARTSSEPEWANSIYAVSDPEAHTTLVEDLSE